MTIVVTKNLSSYQNMASSFVIQSPSGKDKIECNDIGSCAEEVYNLPYFHDGVEQIIDEGEDFGAVQDLLDEVKITGSTWEIPGIKTKILFSSPEYARRIRSEIEDIAEDKYNQGLQEYKSQFGGQEPEEPNGDEGEEPNGDEEPEEPNSNEN